MIQRLAVVVTFGIAALVSPGAGAQTAPPAESPAVLGELREAFSAAYNLDYDEARAHARRAVALDPDSARAHRGYASILWLHMLFKRGAVSVDHYMGSISKSQVALPRPDPADASDFKYAITRAVDLANARLRAQPRDLQARFDTGAAYGLQASYTASVEGSLTAAFGLARKAFNAQEEVLEKDPSRVAAGVVVGTYRYIVSTLALPTRVFAYIVGFGGGKEKGIALLESAARDPEARVDAQAALMLIYSREGRHAAVVRIARELGAAFPRNRLFVLEEGAAAIRAGRPAEAVTALTRGIDGLSRDRRPRVPGEDALWHYKRGLAKLNLNQQAASSVDLKQALSLEPVKWVRGRIHVELGKLADLAGRRDEATAEYRTAKTLCKESADGPCENEANRLLKRPFSFSER